MTESVENNSLCYTVHASFPETGSAAAIWACFSAAANLLCSSNYETDVQKNVSSGAFAVRYSPMWLQQYVILGELLFCIYQFAMR